MQKQNNESLSDSSSNAMLSSSDERQTEITVLKSIYADEIKEKNKYNNYSPYCFDLQIVATSQSNTERSAVFQFSLGVNYPRKEPRIKISDDFNLTTSQRKQLLSKILANARESKGEAMIHKLALAAKDFMNNLDVTKKDGKDEKGEKDIELQEAIDEAIEEKKKKAQIIEDENSSFMDIFIASHSVEENMDDQNDFEESNTSEHLYSPTDNTD
ncbi:Eukaryotic translation initiation factor 2 alpha kinase 4, partial [Bonamia ostreae]